MRRSTLRCRKGCNERVDGDWPALSAGDWSGAGLGLMLSAAFADQAIQSALLQIAPIAIGLCSGLTLRAFNTAFSPDSGTVRVAKSTQPRVHDFIRPRAWILLQVSVPVATVVCVAMAVQPIWTGLDFTITGSGPLWAAAAPIPFSCALTYVLVRRLLRRPTPGESPRSHVWHDALRREMTVDLCMLPCVAVLLAALIVYSWVSNPWADLPYYPGLSLAVSRSIWPPAISRESSCASPPPSPP